MARAALSFVLATVLLSSLAEAQVPAGEDTWDGGFDLTQERRAAVALGVAAGVAAGESHGVLNEVEQLNDDSFQQSTGFAFGDDAMAWLGGALTDWFTVGLGFAAGSYRGGELQVRRQSYLFRIDAYPLYSLGGGWRDLGVAMDTGVGRFRGFQTSGEEAKVIEGGSVMSVGIGGFWEGLRFARQHFGAGPFVHYRLLRGLPSTSHTASLGLRLTCYTGKLASPSAPQQASVGRRRF